MIVSVASGKGGTGKTLISTSIAKSIENIQFFDCDVEEPNSFYFIKPEIEEEIPVKSFIPEVDYEKCNFCKKCQEICRFNAISVVKNKVLIFENLCHHCGACIWVCPQNAMKEKDVKLGTVRKGKAGNIEFIEGKLEVGQPVAPPLIKEVKKRIKKDKNIIIDCAPGVACPMVNGIYGSDFVILVTDPTPFGFYDLKLAIEICEKLNLKKGVIINRYDGKNGIVERYCEEKKIPVLLKIPFDRKIAENYSTGKTLSDFSHEFKEKFRKLFEDKLLHEIGKQKIRRDNLIR